MVRLIRLTITEAVTNADDAGVRSELWSQASNLTDILLDSLKTHLDSVENVNLYGQLKQDVQVERSALLDLFLKSGQYERAAILAEKYVDFSALLTVCDAANDEVKLNEYIDKLGDTGFTEYACKWSVFS